MIKVCLIIVSVLCLLIGVLAFFVADRQKRLKELEEEKKSDSEQLKKAEEQIKKSDQVINNYKKEKAKYEELQTASKNDTLAGHNASIELMQKLEESGRKRNNNNL